MTTSDSDGLTSCTWKVAVATSGSCSQSTVSSATRPMYSLCSRSMTRLARARSSHTSPGEEMKNCSFLTFRPVIGIATVICARLYSEKIARESRKYLSGLAL